MRKTLLYILIGAVFGSLLAGGVAIGDSLINGAKIKNHTITSNKLSKGLNARAARVESRLRALEAKAGIPGPAGPSGQSGTNGKNGSAGNAGPKDDTGATGAQGVAGPAGATGPAGPAGQNGSNATITSGHWGVIARNEIGSPQVALRAGPATPPVGLGSLGIETGSGAEKAAYGNETDFAGDSLSALGELSYSIYTTGENVAINPRNLPSLGIEVDPTGANDSTAPNYSTLVYLPPAIPANQWSTVDAVNQGDWYFTGAAGTASGCNQTTYCTLAQAQAAFPNATLLSIQITKGRDYEFHGAVDALRVNSKVFDFEESGVSYTTD